eukprot:CAMPEP_0116871136 /NCGR_PEP_ID=MMETSP0463-20121206/1353_1 /TAXON_ID=181622 /ORGANISM="Strombidinopsis sp, Strain SopsisLIS2011" /LENGTH=64 /DNA_ID=CAMNT_0004508989 /DNA_START=1762 /DNA_END=1956 /DNA_ORIENTATION=+
MAQEGVPRINRYAGKMSCGYQYFLYDNQESEAIYKENLELKLDNCAILPPYKGSKAQIEAKPGT